MFRELLEGEDDNNEQLSLSRLLMNQSFRWTTDWTDCPHSEDDLFDGDVESPVYELLTDEIEPELNDCVIVPTAPHYS